MIFEIVITVEHIIRVIKYRFSSWNLSSLLLSMLRTRVYVYESLFPSVPVLHLVSFPLTRWLSLWNLCHFSFLFLFVSVFARRFQTNANPLKLLFQTRFTVWISQSCLRLHPSLLFFSLEQQMKEDSINLVNHWKEFLESQISFGRNRDFWDR